MDHKGDTGSRVVVTVQPGETKTVTLDGGTRYQLWLLTDTNVSKPQYPAPTVVGPDDSDVAVTLSSPRDFHSEGYHYAYGLWEMKTADAGGYTISVPTDHAIPDASVAATPAIDDRQLWLHTELSETLWFGAPALGFTGFGMTLGGIIWWAVRRNRSRTPTWPTAPYAPYPQYPPPPPR